MRFNGLSDDKLAASFVFPPGTSPAWYKISQTPELLSLIFTFCLPRHNMMPSENIAPILLTHVCRSWRYLTLSTPQLWSSLRLKMPHDQLDEIETLRILRIFLRMLRTYLSRSGAVDLSLDIDLSSTLYGSHSAEEDTNNRLVSSLVSCILPLSQKWRHLYLAAPLQYMTPVLEFVGCGDVSQLDSLTLDFSCETAFPYFGMDRGEQRSFTTVLDVSLVKHLTALTMYGNADDTVIIRWNPANVPVSLSHVMLWDVRLDVITHGSDSLRSSPLGNSLQKLCLSASISSRGLLSTLQSSPRLEDLTLDVRLQDDGLKGREFGLIIHLRNLRRLHISVGEATSELFDHLHLPSLTCLEYTSEEGHTMRGPTPKLVSLLQRSEPPLKFFMLCDGLESVREDELIALLQHMSTLEELRVLKQGLGDQTLRALTMDNAAILSEMDGDYSENAMLCDPIGSPRYANTDAISLCPALISITFTAGNRFSPRAVVDLLLSRCSTHRHQSEVIQPLPTPVVLPSTMISVPSTGHMHGCSIDANFEMPVSSRSAPLSASLKMFQGVLEQHNVIMENPLVKRCIEQGLELHLREAKEFIPVFR